MAYDCATATYKTNPLNDFVANCAPASWKDFFQLPAVAIAIQFLTGMLSKEGQTKSIEPPMPLMFKALDMVAPNQVKVVILGQDPTPQAGKATGLAFSVADPRTVGTVLNVLLEVALEGFSVNVNNGDLTKWAQQGVLLLNTALTVRQGSAGSHVAWWKDFTNLLIDYISANAQQSAWLLWGKEAQKFKDRIAQTKHYIITGGHPSALGGIGTNTFIGGNYFNCANTFLANKGRIGIDWKLAPNNVLNPCPPEPIPSPMTSPKGKKPKVSFRRSD